MANKIEWTRKRLEDVLWFKEIPFLQVQGEPEIWEMIFSVDFVKGEAVIGTGQVFSVCEDTIVKCRPKERRTL